MRATMVALAVLTAGQAAADAARARKALEERLIPLTAQELLQRASRDEVEVVGLMLEAGVGGHPSPGPPPSHSEEAAPVGLIP